MKIRNSFVSNSSSSSFVVRGIMTTAEALQALGVPIDGEDDAWSIQKHLEKTHGIKMAVETTRYYFGGDPTGEFIIGKNIADLDDGCVTELPETDDTSIMKDLRKIGISVDKLSTFVQFVSNDNY
jgi:hypothetical protein